MATAPADHVYVYYRVARVDSAATREAVARLLAAVRSGDRRDRTPARALRRCRPRGWRSTHGVAGRRHFAPRLDAYGSGHNGVDAIAIDGPAAHRGLRAAAGGAGWRQPAIRHRVRPPDPASCRTVRLPLPCASPFSPSACTRGHALVIAANRDEDHARATARAQWWAGGLARRARSRRGRHLAGRDARRTLGPADQRARPCAPRTCCAIARSPCHRLLAAPGSAGERCGRS